MNDLRRRLSNSFIIHYLLLFAFGWTILQLLNYFETVIVIFTFAAILAALLNYPVRWLQVQNSLRSRSIISERT